MSCYAAVVALCWLFPTLIPLDPCPAPPPRPVPDLQASAFVAERLLVKEYGADAKGIKGAKVQFAFRATQPDDRSETGQVEDLFAIAADEIVYSDDGLVTLKGARYVQHHHFPRISDGTKSHGWKATNPQPSLLRVQFDGPVRSLQDIHKAKLKQFECGTVTLLFEKADVKIIAK